MEEIEIRKVENGFIVKYEDREDMPMIGRPKESEKFVAKTVDEVVSIIRKKFPAEKENKMGL